MNVRLLLVCWSVASSVCAGTLGDWVADPLLAKPPVLRSGAILPNDAVPAPCLVNKDFGSPLSLPEAADIALCNNAQIKASWANIKIQTGALGEARAAYLPTISGAVSRLKTTTTYPDLPISGDKSTGHTVSGNFNWMLFDFGGRSANLEAANLLLQAALSNHDATLQKTLTALIQTYFDAVTAKAALAAREDALKIAHLTLTSAQKKEQRGATGRSDTLQAETAVAKADLARSRAEGDYRKTLAVLIYTMGVPPETDIILPDLSGAPHGNMTKQLDDWIQEAETSHPAIAAARAEWHATEKKITSTRAQFLPRIDFGVNYYQNGYPNQGLQSTSTNTKTVGITLSVPIFDGSSTYKVYSARAQAEQKEQELRDTEQQVIMQVVKTYSDTVSSLNNLQSSETLFKSAQDALNSSRRRYDKGAADITEILNTQSAYDDAQQERVRSLSEWQAARLSLFAAAGSIGRGVISGEVGR